MMNKVRAVLATKLPSGSFARNVLTLMTGTTFAQALIILVAPVLTRLYTPADFGVFALYTSVLAIVAVAACGRYELAIVLPEKDEDAANLLSASVLICFGMAVLILLLVALFGTQLADLLGAPDLAPWLWIMPVSVVAAGLFKALNYWCTRRKQFKRLATRTITQSIATSVTQIGAGLILYPDPSGLICGTVIGQVAATARLAWQIGKDDGKLIVAAVNKTDLKRVLRRYIRFPLFDSWSGMLNTASTMLPALLLGYFFTPAVVGYYALGHRVLAMPMGVVGGSIAQVFFPRANEAKLNGELDQLSFAMFQRLLKIGLVPILLITIIAPDLFALLFGACWVTAGEYVRWMSLWLLFVFISSPLSNIYSVMEKQREGLIVNIIMFISRLAVLVIGGMKGDPLLTIALFGSTGAILWVFNCMYIQHLAGVSVLKVTAAITRQILCSIPYGLLPVSVWLGTQNSLAFVSAGIGAGIVFLIVQGCRIRKAGMLV